VLAYHSIDDHCADPYTVRTTSFRNQITALSDCGFDFLDASTLLDVIAGRTRVSRPSVLVTFDDGYVSVADNAAPVLHEHGIPAVVFAVTDQIAGTNLWDHQHGAAKKPLLDAGQLASLSNAGWAIGSHTRSHRHLRLLPRDELADELRGPLSDLADAGLPRARLLAYPFGEHDIRVRAAAAAAGYSAAFALGGGRIATGDRRRFMLPRLEVGAPMTAGRLVRRLQGPARTSAPGQAKREVGGVLRLVGESMPAWGSK
jgi:peptidoglycan/xylan/chitin deacetylase (PgdA/CDA1 family)